MRKHIMIFNVLFVLILCCCFAANADEDRKSGLFSYRLKGNGNAVITGFDWGNNNSQDVYIPRLLDGYTVSEVGPYAFSLQSDSLSMENRIGEAVVVVLPDTVTMIGEKAFFCTNITALSIPASVEYIGEGAFAGCRNITMHSVQSGNKTYATINGFLYNKIEKALIAVPAGKEYNETISIPDGIKSIGAYAFFGISIISDNNATCIIDFPEGLQRIGNYAFAFSKLKASDFNNYPEAFPKSIEEIGNNAYYGATLERLSINNLNSSSLRSIGDYAFAYIHLIGAYDEIVNNGFVTFSNTLSHLGEGAFSHFDYPLFGFDLQNTIIDEIPDYAFCGANIMEAEIKLPNTIKRIGKHAFAELFLEGEGIEEYGDDAIWLSTKIQIPNSVVSIDSYAFAESYVSLGFSSPSQLKEINAYAFYRAAIWNYESEDHLVVIPDGVESIGAGAFQLVTDLQISIPSSVNEIGADVCNRSTTKFITVPGSYAAVFASENGYLQDDEDTSWLND